MKLIEQIISKVAQSESEIYESKVVTFINPFSYLQLKDMDVDLRDYHTVGIDGISLVQLLRAFNVKTERFSFDYGSVAKEYFNKLGKEDRIVILGSDKESNSKFADHIKKSFNLNIIFARNGYFEDEEELNKALDEIILANPTHVIIGMGGGLQERIGNQLIGKGYSRKLITCGGFIHQTAVEDGSNYYPNFVNKFNLRALYRMYKEPKVIKRVLIDYPIAFVSLVKELIRLRFNKRQPNNR